MVLSITEHNPLAYVPEVFEEEFRFEIMEHYLIAAQENNVICLDESIVHMMTFLHFRILYYIEHGELLDPDVIQDNEEWRYLNEEYPFDKHKREITELRKDIKTILLERQMFFEENWLYADAPSEYIYENYNSPLQPVW